MGRISKPFTFAEVEPPADEWEGVVWSLANGKAVLIDEEQFSNAHSVIRYNLAKRGVPVHVKKTPDGFLVWRKD